MKKILSIVLGILFCVGCIFAESDAQSQSNTMFNDTINREAEDFVTVSLLISEPMKGILSPYGHTALRLQCPTFDLDYVFHYVMLHYVDEYTQTATYLSSKFQIRMVAEAFEMYVQDSENKERGLKEYMLNLTPKQEQELWRILDEETQDHRILKRDFFVEDYKIKGCALLMADMIERVVGRSNFDYSDANPFYHRPHYEIISRQLQYVPWAHFGMITSMYGQTKLDYAEKLVVPSHLAEVWQETIINGKPFAEGEKLLTKQWHYTEDIYFTPMRIAIMLLLISLISLFVRREYLTYLILAVQVFMAIFVLSLDIFQLSTVRFSWLYIPFNMLPIICWKWRKYWALPYAMVLVTWCLIMVFVPHMLVDTTHIILTLAFAIVLLKQSNIFSHLVKRCEVNDKNINLNK